jgi:hypothetical protein
MKEKGLKVEIEIELTSGDESHDSNISVEGLPEADLNYVIDYRMGKEIKKRRNKRFLNKITARMDAEAIQSVVQVI